jgi:hypothetical protein
MRQRDEAWLRHQQMRWLRPDAYRWLRPDAARFLKPGSDPAEIYPAWELKSYRDQPRVPRGNPDGGQWTRDGESSSQGNATVEAQSGPQPADASAPVESSDPYRPQLQEPIGPAAAIEEIKPVVPVRSFEQGPTEQPPDITPEKPKESWQRTAFLRAAANWLAQNGGLAGSVFMGAIANVEWLQDRQALILAAAAPPQTYEEMQAGVGKKRPGYDDHHVVEQTWAEYFGFSRDQIDDPENRVSIPRLKHWEITGWYATRSDEFGGRSPREYLQDKTWAERRTVGLRALERFGVLVP